MIKFRGTGRWADKLGTLPVFPKYLRVCVKGKHMKDDWDNWKLCDEFNVIQTAILIIYPEDTTMMQKDVECLDPAERPAGFDAVFSALKSAIMCDKLKACRFSWGTREARINEVLGPDEVIEAGENFGRDIVINRFPDWKRTTIQREDIMEWLLTKNLRPPFFFEQSTTKPAYLDPKNQYYSPKLAAAVRAWEAVTSDPKYRDNGKAPKSNIEKWLTSHAKEFGLVKEDGEINNDAIKNQISKVSNWKTDGGAPRTPTK